MNANFVLNFSNILTGFLSFLYFLIFYILFIYLFFLGGGGGGFLLPTSKQEKVALLKIWQSISKEEALNLAMSIGSRLETVFDNLVQGLKSYFKFQIILVFPINSEHLQIGYSV